MNLLANPRLLSLLSAAHALGTLRGGARRRFETLAREQAGVRASALLWHDRLASLTELQTPITPGPAVWTRIRNLVDADQQAEALLRQRQAPPPPAALPPRGWWRSLTLWRGAAAAGALATVLAVVVGAGLREQLLNAPQVQYVAVLADDQSAASMLVTFDPQSRQLTLQRVGGYHEATDRSLQLWALPQGAAPRSLGVLAAQPVLQLTATESDLRAVPALAISLEPKGGVPSASGPTGPVLFKGALIEKTL